MIRTHSSTISHAQSGWTISATVVNKAATDADSVPYEIPADRITLETSEEIAQKSSHIRPWIAEAAPLQGSKTASEMMVAQLTPASSLADPFRSSNHAGLRSYMTIQSNAYERRASVLSVYA